MRRFFAVLFSIFLCVSIWIAGTSHATTYPQPVGYVNDFAGVLSEQFKNELENKLSQFDEETTNEIAVVTIKTTGGEDIDEYSIHLADEWKVGQEGKDNGVIMLFAVKDRQMRIEVGRGLEGELTDSRAWRIIDEMMIPEFKKEKYERGIAKGVDEVMKIITVSEGIEASEIVVKADTQTKEHSKALPVITFAFLSILAVIIIYIVSKSRKAKSHNSETSGSEPRSSGNSLRETVKLAKQTLAVILCEKCGHRMVNIDADEVVPGDLVLLKKKKIRVSNPETEEPICLKCEYEPVKEEKETFGRHLSGWLDKEEEEEDDDDDDDDSRFFTGAGIFGGSRSSGGFGGSFGGFGGGAFSGGGASGRW